jgi:SAM-dependent methyltransferase
MMDSYDRYARFYDLDYAGTDVDLPMFQQFAARCGSPILELGCGTGRLLLPLARQGFCVTGVDTSPAMLDQARQKVSAEALQVRVTLVEQDMRHLDLDGRFNLAFSAINSFMHLLSIDDQLTALVRIRQHLNPGGLLILDLFNPDLGRLLDFRGQLGLGKVMKDPATGRQLMKFHSETVDLGQQTIQVTYIVDEMDTDGHLQRTLYAITDRRLMITGEGPWLRPSRTG